MNGSQMSENDNNSTDTNNIGSGYVSPNSRNTTLPMLGHMVTYRFMEKKNTSFTVTYREMVERAQQRGLPRDFIPTPRFGRNAFKWARKAIETSTAWESVPLNHPIAWDSLRCRVMYRCKKMVNDYVIQRIETGKVNGVEHTETRNLYRVKYVAGSGDPEARAYHLAYVKRAWEGHDALTESEQEVLENEKDGSGNIEIEAYVEGTIDNVSYYAQARELIVSRYKQEIHTIDNRVWRDKVRQLLLNRFNAIPFTAIRGAFVVPDMRKGDELLDGEGKRTAPAYLDELDALDDLIRWFGDGAVQQQTIQLQNENLPGVASEEEEQKQETQQSLTEQLQKMHRSRCQMTIMGYIDDDSQRAELQEAMTFEINRIMGDYNKEVIRTVNMMKTDDQEAVDRQTARLEKKKAETQKALEFYCGGDYIEGVNVHEELHQPAMAGLMTRLSAIGSEGINTSRLTNLVNFDESISPQGE